MKVLKRLSLRFGRGSSKKQEPSSLAVKCYSGISDLPLWNWNEIHEKGDLSLLMRNPEPVTNKREFESLTELWNNIVREFVKKFGFGDSFVDLLEKQKQIALLKIKRAITDDRTLNALIRIMELDVEKMKKAKQEKALSFSEMKAMVEKQMGFMINPRQVTVEEFHSYITVLNKNANGRK